MSRGFAALQAGEFMASALTTPHGAAAMVNMVIVQAPLRRLDIARLMIDQVMAAPHPPRWQLVAGGGAQVLDAD